MSTTSIPFRATIARFVKTHRRLLACVALMGVAAGCAQVVPSGKTYIVKVNATAAEAPKKGAGFALVPTRGSVDDSTLLYAEAAQIVTGALQMKGLHAAPSVEKADVIIELDYGMVSPRIASLGATPPPTPDPSRADIPMETDVTKLRSAARGPLEKRLVLTAREVPSRLSEDAPRTLWSVEVSTIDVSNDLRKYLPLLTAAALDQIGTDSGGTRLVRIGENDKTVGMLQPAQ